MNTATHYKIEKKTRELEDLKRIRALTRALAEQLGEIEQKLETMADGSESVALVLSNWKNVMSSVSLASLGLAKYAGKPTPSEALPEPLVRISLSPEHEERD